LSNPLAALSFNSDAQTSGSDRLNAFAGQREIAQPALCRAIRMPRIIPIPGCDLRGSHCLPAAASTSFATAHLGRALLPTSLRDVSATASDATKEKARGIAGNPAREKRMAGGRAKIPMWEHIDQLYPEAGPACRKTQEIKLRHDRFFFVGSSYGPLVIAP
jgi:hypothetical protein